MEEPTVTNITLAEIRDELTGIRCQLRIANIIKIAKLDDQQLDDLQSSAEAQDFCKEIFPHQN